MSALRTFSLVLGCSSLLLLACDAPELSEPFDAGPGRASDAGFDGGHVEPMDGGGIVIPDELLPEHEGTVGLLGEPEYRSDEPRPDEVAPLAAVRDYELAIKTCSTSPLPTTGDVLELTLQVAGEAYGWPLNNAGGRARGATDRYAFAWPSDQEADQLQSIKLNLRGTGAWCVESATLSWLGPQGSVANNRQTIWSWNKADAQNPSFNYLHGHPETGAITLDNDFSTRRAPFVRFSLPSFTGRVWQHVDTSQRWQCEGSERRGFYFRTCAESDSGINTAIKVTVRHDDLVDFFMVPVSGVAQPRAEADELHDNFCMIHTLQSIKLSKVLAIEDNWRVCEVRYHNFTRLLAVGGNYISLWSSEVPRNVTATSFTYTVNHEVDPCTGPRCVVARQGFPLVLDDRVKKCLAGTNPADNTCNGVDDDCDGRVDQDWDPNTATSCAGECRARATCSAGAVACGAPQTEIPGNGRNDDCDARTDEINPRGACSADSQCDAGFVCHDGICIAPSCSNGVWDRGDGESGRDCGGPHCKACDGLACDNQCRVGSPTNPDSQATLAFRSGAFTRVTAATYEVSPGQLATAQANQLRWVAAGGSRLALFEGASQNELLFSSEFNRAPAWALPAGSTATLAVNAANAPDGTASAELLRYPAGPARGPTQTRVLSAGGWTLSYYARNALDEIEYLPRARSFVVGPTNSVLAQRDLSLDDVWKRATSTFVAPSSGSHLVALSQAAAWPTADVAAVGAPDTEIWGGQLEAKPFPTSYIPTASGPATRTSDSLLFTAVPGWLHTAMWQLEVRPQFASSETIPAWRHTLVSAAGGWDIAFVAGIAAGSARLSARSAAASYTSSDLVWDRNTTLRVTVDPVRDVIYVDGADGGDTSFAVPGLSFTATRLRIGGMIDSTGEAFAAISEPRRVAQKDGTCTQDPSCACGNGALDTGEICDTAVGACSSGCQDTERTPCASDEECPTGQVCDDIADRIGELGGQLYCWPASCRADAASACGSEGSPCGTCVCTPSCQNAVCGASNSDGCGGKCGATCPDRAPGCEATWECRDGFSCGMQVGEAFGLAADVNVCWPDVCESPRERLKHCGDETALCGKCPPANECGAQQRCGTDRYGNSCGECAEGQVCSEAGACSDVPHTPPPEDVRRRREVPSPNDVGTLPGTFRVDDNGAAQYSIPLEVPPGQGGLAPELALVYQSSTGYAYAGTGWSITGLSAITRCARTFAQDGYARGVRNDAGDAFCLDGARLVAISGEYGADGSQYRTELDSFQKIVSYGGSVGAGPLRFQVWSKDGRIRTYGASDNARVTRGFRLAGGVELETNVSWMLEKVEDRSGNRMRVEYKQDVFNKSSNAPLSPVKARWHVGEMRPAKILYGPDESREVLFEYGMDSNIARARSFRGGVPRHVTAPIEQITMHVERRKVRQYSLYQPPGSWQLQSVTGCTFQRDAEGGEVQQCMPPTTFDYAPREEPFKLIATTTDAVDRIPVSPDYNLYDEPNNLSAWRGHPLDHDGDGKQDLVHSAFENTGYFDDDTYLYLRKSRGEMVQGSAFFARGEPARSRCAFKELVDWNGDGRDDYLGDCFKTKHEESRELRIILSQGDGFVARPVVDTQNRELGLAGKQAKGGDFDGDGLLDLVTDAKFYRNVGQKFAEAATFETEEPAKCSPFDVDGDGVAEALCSWGGISDGREPSKFATYSPRPDGSVERTDLNWPAELARVDIYNKRENHNSVFADVNGDGITDIVTIPDENLFLPSSLYLGTGVGYEFATRSGRPVASDFPTVVLDVDGDGAQEFLEARFSLNKWEINRPYNMRREELSWLNESTNVFFTTGFHKEGILKHHPRFYQRPRMMDWDGDGENELVTRVPLHLDRPFEERDYRNPVLQIWRVASRRQGLLTKVTDGLQKVTEITYDCEKPDPVTGTCKPKYTFGTSCTYPQKCLKHPPKPVVVRHTESGVTGPYRDLANPVNASAMRLFEYSYEDARMDQRGRGWLGFKRRTIKEFSAGTELLSSTVLEYDLESHDDDLRLYYAAGSPKSTTTEVSASAPTLNGPSTVVFRTTSERTFALHDARHGRKFMAPLKTLTTSQIRGEGDAVAAATSEVERSFLYDEWGNATRMKTRWSDGREQLVTTRFAASDVDGNSLLDQWLIGLPDELTVEDRERGFLLPDGDIKTLRETFQHDAHGRLAEHRLYGPDGVLEDQTSFRYTDHGNIKHVTKMPRDAYLQLQTTVYDQQDMFPASTTSYLNPAVAPMELEFDPATGQLTSRRDHDGTLHSWNYDGFGRLRSTTDAVGRTTRIDYKPRGGQGARYTVTQTGDGMPMVETEYNDFSQPIRTRTYHWGDVAGVPLRGTQVEYGYDERGRLETQGVPHFDGTASPGAHRYRYDNLGRLTTERHPVQDSQGVVTNVALTHRYGHRGFSGGDESDLVRWGEVRRAWSAHSVEGPEQPRSIQVMDQRGNIVGSFDALGTLTTYAHGAFDWLRSSTTLGSTTSYVRDSFGRVTRQRSPDSGTSDMVYDGAGRVRELRRNAGTAEAQLSTYSYDALGRMDGAVTPDGTYGWHYDGDFATPSLLGKLDRESVRSERSGTTSTEYAYGGPGHALSEVHRVIEGKTYSSYVEHDRYGRPEFVRYPQVDDEPLTVVKYHYQERYGRLDAVYHGDDLEHPLWKLEDVDAFGNARKVKLRNGLVTTREHETTTGLPSRLHTTSANGATTYQDDRLVYDVRGLLSLRTQEGRSTSYAHDELGRLKTVSSGLGRSELAFDYDLRGNLISKTRPVLPDTDIGELYYTDSAHPHRVMATQDGRSFDYDEHGRQDLREGQGIAGGRQEIDYTAFDLPVEVRSGPDNAPTETTRYQYDANHQRIVQASSTGEKTVYAGELYEKTTSSAGGQRRLRIPLPDGSSVEELFDGGPAELRFHTVDHLGSPTLITGEEQDDLVQAVLAYTPFGALDAQRSEINDPRVKASFTGHEYDPTGIINMRGRMYDPATGRFLSADPLVQAPSYSQSWNRYSYVFNSPLGLVDPSGFQSQSSGWAQPDEWVKNGSNDYTTPTVAADSVPDSGGPLLADGTLNINGGPDPTLNAVLSGSYGSGNPMVELANGVGRGSEGLTNFAGKAIYAASGLLPGIGEYQDVEVLLDATASKWETNLAAASLAASVLSLGLLPNFGTLRAGKELLQTTADVAGDAARGAPETVDLYRAVGVREFDDVMSSGMFRPNTTNSMEGRQFGFTLEEALKYADNDVSKVAVLKATIEKSALQAFDFSNRIDPHIFKNGVITVQPGAQSSIFHQALQAIEHAF